MVDSILSSIKKSLGVHETDTSFDTDILMYINGVFPTLEQLGIGPPGGYMIEDANYTWDQYLANDYNLNSVKSYMFMRVRLLFDPPATSFHLNALKEQIKEEEWRLNTRREGESWTMPVTTLPSTEY